MPPTGAARTQVFAAKDHAHLTPYLAGLHAQCITSDKSIATFLPPLSHEKLLAWWKDRIAEATAGTRIIVMLLLGSQPGERVQGDSLVGVAMLAIPRAETSPFRASVESVLVSTKYRRRHGATALLGAIEQEAVTRSKTLLVSSVAPRSWCGDDLCSPYSIR